MDPGRKRGFWSACRVYFRRVRITVWLVLLALVGAVIYVNQVGLPDFIKRPLLQRLREQGVDLQFSRLRWRWHQGVVAEHVRFGPADAPAGLALTASAVEVRLDLQALARLQVLVDGLVVRGGQVVLSLAESNGVSRELSLKNLQTELRFLPNDQWALQHFDADFSGSRLHLSGVVTNASRVRDWPIFKGVAEGAKPEGAETWRPRLQRFSEVLDRVRFSGAPDLYLDVRGDADDLQSFDMRASLFAPGATTPWGTVSQGKMLTRVFPAEAGGISRAEVRLNAADAQTPWGGITNLHLDLDLATIRGQSNVVNAQMRFSAREAHTEWCGATNVVLEAGWVHAITNPIPLSGKGRVYCGSARTAWGGGAGLELTGRLVSPEGTNQPAPASAAWGWWTNLQPYVVDWQCRLEELWLTNFEARALACTGSWQAPSLVVTNLEAKVFEGRFSAQAALDIGTRKLEATLASDFEPRRLNLLPENARGWFDQFSWTSSLQLTGQVALTLPSWTNRQPDWAADVLPTLYLNADLNLGGGGAFRDVRIDSAHSHVIHSNQCWLLPDITLSRPEGRVEAQHWADDRTGDFRWHITSTMDPKVLVPLLEAGDRKAFDLFTLNQPPFINADIWGRARSPESTGVRARVAATNFSFRGFAFSGLQASLDYTNRVLRCYEPRVQCGAREMRADGVLADFNRELVFLTNGFSTADPMLVAGAIGSNVARVIRPFQFIEPPVARVHGIIPMHGEDAADLYFDLEGGPFHWWKFTMPHVSGQVHWAGQSLSLTNVNADFYGGQAAGYADFDFRPKRGDDFQFTATVTNVLFSALVEALSSGTNSPEGRLDGAVHVTRGNTEDWRSVNGYGETQLRDGLIWNIPLFGIFSPVLNTISDGLGNSRAKSATCTFVMTNGVVVSDDLELKASTFRLQYRGTVDLEGRVKARVEAELLRDMWVVGPLVTTVFWPVSKLFEYKVTGTLEEPKMQSVYLIPKLIGLPFHPFRALKNLLQEDSKTSRSNAPPATAPEP